MKPLKISVSFIELEMDNTTMTVIAIVAALALLGVVAITVVGIPLLQQAEGRGCSNGIAFNAAKGRCFHP